MADLQDYYYDYSEVLRLADTSLGVAEVHGVFTGLLVVSPGAALTLCIDHIFDDEIDEHDVNVKAGLKCLETLFDQTRSSLNEQDMGFSLLLPDDESPIEERGRALRSWCQGFLFGLGLAGLDVSESDQSELGELLHDIIDIGKLAVEGLEDNEENENDLFELIEYVRVGVLYIQEEIGSVPDTSLH